MKTNSHQPAYKIRQLLLVAGIASIMLVSGGYLYYSFEENTNRKEKFNYLNAITELKISQILQWRKERLGDAIVTSQGSLFKNEVELWLTDTNILAVKNNLISQLSIIKSQYGYSEAIVFSPGKHLFLSSDKNTKSIDTVLLSNVNKAFEQNEVIFTDFNYCYSHNQIHIGIIAPVPGKANKPIAVLILLVNASDYIYPLIQTWPTPSKTAETLIIKRNGDSVLFVNELRHISNTALKLQISLAETEVPAVQAVLGHVGFWEGKDYRGVEVLSVLRPIAGTPWFMVAKVDKSEIYNELYYRALLIIVLVSLLIFLLGAALAWIYSYSQNKIYKELFSAEIQLNNKEAEFRVALYSIGDGVITTDIHGRIRQMNNVAEQLTGWTESKAIGKEIEEVFKIINEENRNPVESPVEKVIREGITIGLANHTLLISVEGKETPIADSGAPIINDSGEISGVILVFRDQTIEREAECRLRESEEKFRKAFFTSPDSMTITRLDDGVYIALNNGFTNIFGYSVEEIIGKTSLEIKIWQIPDDREKFIDGLKAKGIVENFETKLITKDLVIKDCLVSASIIEFDGVSHILSITRDDTGRKQAEEKLRESERKLREAQAMAHMGFWSWDINSGVVEWSDEAYNIFGLDPKEFTPHIASILSLSPWPEDHQRDKELINYATETRSPGHYEQRFLRPDKSIGYYYSTFKGNYDNNGSLISIVGAGIDITERKRIEIALRESEEKYRLIADNANDWIYLLAPDRKIQYISPSCEKVTGYVPEEFISNPGLLEDIVYPDDRDTFNVHLQLVHDEVEPHNIEFRIVRKNGEIRWISHSCNPVFADDGKFAGRSGTNRDITERKQAEEEIRILNAELEERVARRTAQLESVNAELEAFSYSVSHDLRAPLRGINGFAQILMEDYAPKLDSEAKRICSIIQENSQKMGHLIDDLLAFSRLGRSELHHSFVEMSSMVNSVFNEITDEKSRERIILTIGKIPNLNADRTMLKQVWANLLSNAVKYSSKKEKSVISVLGKNENNKCIYSIKDNGVGFDMKYLNKLFGVFQRLHNVKDFDGTGVGLAIVQRIVHRHGGEVWAEGEVNNGATFYFSLPANSGK